MRIVRIYTWKNTLKVQKKKTKALLEKNKPVFIQKLFHSKQTISKLQNITIIFI